MENSLKGLILAAGTIITCVVISLGFFISSCSPGAEAWKTRQKGPWTPRAHGSGGSAISWLQPSPS